MNPAGTETVDGVFNVELVLARVTTMPPAGAGWFTLRVQVPPAFDPRLVGLQATADTTTGASRIIVAACELLPRVAVTVAL